MPTIDRPSSRRDPSALSISSTEDDATEVIEISSTSSTSSRHSTTHSSSTPSPHSNSPHNLVLGHIISWASSDGTNTVPEDLHNGTHTRYYEKAQPGSRTYQKYLEQVGTHVAQTVFGYTDAPYFMEDLPTGYSLYGLHSKPESSGKSRVDYYLYGPKDKRFRSPNEFTMHAVWLMGGGPHNPELCKCINCGTMGSQILINRTYGLPGRQDPKDHHHHT
ncbi:unnamed protein product [Rhizoctonia solani]|uniref:Cryptic loci regulator 2 N-terminal domain-containing protein n=1 Tax=Rhizoctonia solani TaxID=456999 RepID=A0A8H3BLG7_9AGAM|nr:unnamed protein product [Rhizoctonia solani]